jgi:hypothetical protein
MISFNIMKSNFDPNTMRSIAARYTNGIEDAKERQLLKYISLLHAHDYHGHDVPVNRFQFVNGQKLGDSHE